MVLPEDYSFIRSQRESSPVYGLFVYSVLASYENTSEDVLLKYEL